MSDYFAKSFPVEGGFRRVVKNEQGIPIDYHQEVKLFLCSRDIQVGDILKHIDGKTEGTYEGFDDRGNYFVTNDNFPYGNMSKDYFDKNFVKVIGEISPEATWVKEGDEFDKDDWKYSIVLNNKRIECPESWFIETDLKDKRDPKIQIIGSCGHFH